MHLCKAYHNNETVDTIPALTMKQISLVILGRICLL